MIALCKSFETLLQKRCGFFAETWPSINVLKFTAFEEYSHEVCVLTLKTLREEKGNPRCDDFEIFFRWNNIKPLAHDGLNIEVINF